MVDPSTWRSDKVDGRVCWPCRSKRQAEIDQRRRERRVQTYDHTTMAAPTMRGTTIIARPGQRDFRAALLFRDRQCVLTGCAVEAMLDAAHIKPLKLCQGDEYWHLDNGIMLRADVHRAFDAGLISFEDDGKLLLRFMPGPYDLTFVTPRPKFTEGQRRFLAGHRKWFHTLPIIL